MGLRSHNDLDRTEDLVVRELNCINELAEAEIVSIVLDKRVKHTIDMFDRMNALIRTIVCEELDPKTDLCGTRVGNVGITHWIISSDL
jgi:hypothetical protein